MVSKRSQQTPHKRHRFVHHPSLQPQHRDLGEFLVLGKEWHILHTAPRSRPLSETLRTVRFVQGTSPLAKKLTPRTAGCPVLPLVGEPVRTKTETKDNPPSTPLGQQWRRQCWIPCVKWNLFSSMEKSGVSSSACENKKKATRVSLTIRKATD